jgi:hypothetical protein
MLEEYFVLANQLVLRASVIHVCMYIFIYWFLSMILEAQSL